MKFDLCTDCGFDANLIDERISLFDLAGPNVQAQSDALQTYVIKPNVVSIIDRFCDSLTRIEEFNGIICKHSSLERLRNALETYLLSLGVDFQQRHYFEERLRIGSIHQDLGVPQSLYQSSFRFLQGLLIQFVPRAMRSDPDAFEEIVQFIVKITALDMSLAVESYCTARVSDLEHSLMSERGKIERLHRLAHTDWLTNLHNHSSCRNFLARTLDHARSEQVPLSVIMADLDHFKNINDTHGHLTGDRVLQIVATRMLTSVRAGDEIGRYGGEEFLFILPNAGLSEGRAVAERVRANISKDTIHENDAQLSVSMSLGVAEARDSDDVNSLIARADSALYAAKLAGRDRVHIEQLDIETEISA